MYFEDPPMPFFPFPRWTDSKEDANGALHSENNGRFVSKGIILFVLLIFHFPRIKL